jgi:hypothetical protein
MKKIATPIPQPHRGAPPDSFDLGPEMMMRSLREEVDGPRRT